jgi:hypothetical protein
VAEPFRSGSIPGGVDARFATSQATNARTTAEIETVNDTQESSFDWTIPVSLLAER